MCYCSNLVSKFYLNLILHACAVHIRYHSFEILNFASKQDLNISRMFLPVVGHVLKPHRWDGSPQTVLIVTHARKKQPLCSLNGSLYCVAKKTLLCCSMFSVVLHLMLLTWANPLPFAYININEKISLSDAKWTSFGMEQGRIHCRSVSTLSVLK